MEFLKKVAERLLRPRTIFAFMFYGTLCHLTLSKVGSPDYLINIVYMLMGYYFGSKNKKEIK